MSISTNTDYLADDSRWTLVPNVKGILVSIVFLTMELWPKPPGEAPGPMISLGPEILSPIDSHWDTHPRSGHVKALR